MRITGGQAKGMVLKTPKSTRTRPTSDKVREAIFDTLGADLSGKTVLDLFAGSGALGIEALSRGARHAVLVENDSAAARVIAANLEKTGFLERAELLRADFRSALRRLNKRGDTFDLVFLDPPYQSDILEEVSKVLSLRSVTSPETIVIVEHFKKTVPPQEIGSLPLADTRIYGQTALSYFNRPGRGKDATLPVR